MTPKRKKRLVLIAMMIVGVGVAIGVALKAFNENLMFFYTPSAVAGGEAPAGHLIRVGGLVTNGSVKRQPDGLTVTFDITDYAETITVQYTGILPDLFREGQGIVARGRLQDGNLFIAEEVLAKHDENYMPPEVADALKTAHKNGADGAATGGVKP
jgi:cytochrome c-type biogenesis protein CcmE